MVKTKNTAHKKLFEIVAKFVVDLRFFALRAINNIFDEIEEFRN